MPEGYQVDLDQAAREAPTGAAAASLPPCDLVMKGGITSGVVYPGAVIAVARSYRLANVGGSSAGAIAAGVSAAAEYGRQRDVDGAGIVRVREVTKALGGDADFMLNLFQPTPGTRQAFELGLTAARAKAKGRFGLARAVLVAAVRRRPLVLVAPVLALLIAAWLVVSTVLTLADAPLGWTIAAGVLAGIAGLAFTAAVKGLALAAALGLPAWNAFKSLPESGFGFCPGSQQDGATGQALIDWLDEAVQSSAGLPVGAGSVLTFGMLAEAGIKLRTTTTDLNSGRPAIVPDGLGAYSFKPSEWRTRFPARVVEHLVRGGRGLAPDAAVDLDDETLCPLPPGDDLPVLVAIRLSLSFPLLLSAMPLYALDGEGAVPRAHLFSDGGIGSNFPIHFFDAWFPSRPTFGLDLVDRPKGATENVIVPGDRELAPRWRETASFGKFIGQIKDSMQNWRDTMQSELPGFRDRVCQIRMDEGQGGLNLQMTPETIQALMGRGYEAGSALVEALPPAAPDGTPARAWTKHRKTRWLTLMHKQQEGLADVAEKAEPFLDLLAAGKVDDYDHGPAAASATRELLAVAAGWAAPPGTVDSVVELLLDRIAPRGPVDFSADPPRPDPVMRVVPPA